MTKKGEFVKVGKAGRAASQTVNEMFSPDKNTSIEEKQKEPVFGYYYSLTADMMKKLNRIAIKWGFKRNLSAVFEKLINDSIGEIEDIKNFANEYVVTTSFRAAPPKRSSVNIPVRMKPIIDELQVQLEIRKYTDLMRLLVAYHAHKMGIDD